MAEPQLVAMKLRPIHCNGKRSGNLLACFLDERCRSMPHTQAEGLRCLRIFVLHPSKAYPFAFQAKELGQLQLDILRGEARLCQVYIQVLSFTGCFVQANLFDDEVFRAGTQESADTRQ